MPTPVPDDQYQAVCDAEDCHRILDLSVPILIVVKGEQEKTVCDPCGQEMLEQGWADFGAESESEDGEVCFFVFEYMCCC